MKELVTSNESPFLNLSMDEVINFRSVSYYSNSTICILDLTLKLLIFYLLSISLHAMFIN